MALPLMGLVRRHRFFLFLCFIPLSVFLFTYNGHSRHATEASTSLPSSGSSPSRWDDWGDFGVVDDDLDLSSHGSGWVSKWKNKGSSTAANKGEHGTVLITGGAGSLAQALAPKLLASGWNVHALDIVGRPATLPRDVVYHRGSILPPSKAVSDLLAQYKFDGVLHFAAISIEQWCSPKEEECERVNAGGTQALMEAVAAADSKAASGVLNKFRKSTTPWVLYASSMDVYGSKDTGTVTEDTERKPLTTVGKTKLAGEDHVRTTVAHAAAVASNGGRKSKLRAAIVRFSEVYGYHRAIAVPASFIPSLLQAAGTSLPIQYSSNAAPIDLLHVEEATEGVLAVVNLLATQAKEQSEAKTEDFNLVHGGKRWLQEEVVDLIRSQTQSLSPVRDIGDHKATLNGVGDYSPERAKEVLEWEPVADLPRGLALATQLLAEDAANYAKDFLGHHCPSSEAALELGQTPVVAEDDRNRHLYRLDNCTVNIGFENRGWMHHLKCEDGKHCGADSYKVISYNWNATVWKVRVIDDEEQPNGKAKVRFEQENGMGFLGMPKQAVTQGGNVPLELYKPDTTEEHVSTFEIEVAPDSSHMRLLAPPESMGAAWTGQLKATPDPSDPRKTYFELGPFDREAVDNYDMRMNVLCCQRVGDWPLLLDDHETSDITFNRNGDISFNSSRRLHLCDRYEKSFKYYTELASVSSQMAAQVPDEGHLTFGKPVSTNKRPDNWLPKTMQPCHNDCASPSICMQTGDCRCVLADSCPRRRENPLIALGRGKPWTPTLPPSPLGKFKAFDPVLKDMVAKTDWRDVLRPEARAYYNANPDFIKVHVLKGYKGEEKVEAADCHKLQENHCFSADSMMYKAMRHLSTDNPDDADLLVLPVYQHCTAPKPATEADFLLHDVYHHASNTVKGIDNHEKSVAIVMTHDWGICLAFTWEIWSSRDIRDDKPTLYPDPIMRNILVFSVQGDWDSNCYRPTQDVVVPARTCRSPDLVAAFPDVASITPMRERTALLTWAGTMWGTGKSERLRITCERGGAIYEELVPGGGRQSIFYDWDYMKDLANARFCPQPKGIAGWSPRVNDAIWAGCIPVLTSEGTHYPFASFLDWSQFSVRVLPTELDRLEEILNAIPLERIEQMQANLIAIRDAVMYPADESSADELKRRGPMFFALHEAGMRLRTRYPDRHAEVKN